MKEPKFKTYLVSASITEKNYFKPEKRVSEKNHDYLIGEYLQNDLYEGTMMKTKHKVRVFRDKELKSDYVNFMNTKIYI